jgi:hypothetical protein
MYVIRHIVSGVVAHRDPKARSRERFLHQIESAELAAFASGSAEVVGRDADKPRAA